MDARAITVALKGRWGGLSGVARCPAHDDRHPSLSINDGMDGKILVHCHTGCPQEKIIEALKRLKLWPEAKPNGQDNVPWSPPLRPLPPIAPPANGPDFKALFHGREISGVWDYLDAVGNLLGYVCRLDLESGRKIFAPVTPLGNTWQLQGFAEPRPLYNLPGLAECPDAPVLIVEGEKTAVAAGELFPDHVCITWSGGAAAPAKADWRPLKGRKVTIWPDNDEAGHTAAAKLGRILLGYATEVRLVRLPAGLQHKWDLADPIPAALDPAALVAGAEDIRAARLENISLKRANVLAKAVYPEIKWAIPGMVPDGVAILAGSKSRGKSFIALDFAVAVASGGNALGNIPCGQGPALYLALEDGERRVKERMLAILQGAPAPEALEVATEWPTIDQGGLEAIEAWIVARPNSRLVIVDVLAKIKGRPDGRLGVYDQDYALVSPFHSLARRVGIAIILVHHTNKASPAADPVLRISGTMGLSGAADTTLVLSRNANEMVGSIDIRGRDVPEREIALQFDNATGTVTQLGTASDYRQSEARRKILTLLELSSNPLHPRDIARETNIRSPSTLSYILHSLLKSGDIAQLPNGKYYHVT